MCLPVQRVIPALSFFFNMELHFIDFRHICTVKRSPKQTQIQLKWLILTEVVTVSNLYLALKSRLRLDYTVNRLTLVYKKRHRRQSNADLRLKLIQKTTETPVFQDTEVVTGLLMTHGDPTVLRNKAVCSYLKRSFNVIFHVQNRI